MLSLIAQAAASPEMTSWLGLLGSLGFAVWYGYYTTAVTIPKINADNNSLTSKIVGDFREEMRLARDTFEKAIKSQQDECQQEVERIVTAYSTRINNLKGPSNT